MKNSKYDRKELYNWLLDFSKNYNLSESELNEALDISIKKYNSGEFDNSDLDIYDIMWFQVSAIYLYKEKKKKFAEYDKTRKYNNPKGFLFKDI